MPFFSLTILSFGLHAMTIDCNYRIATYKDNYGNILISNIYSCMNANISTECDGTPNKVVGMSSNQNAGKVNNDVQMFYIHHQNIKTIPKEVGNFFPNLVVVRMPYLGLQKVTKEDLKQFPNVHFLYLAYNKIERLDSDLFVKTKSLEYVFLDNNQITNIGGNIFDNLPNVHHFYLDKNPCMRTGSFHRRNDLKKLLTKIRSQCPQTQIMQDETPDPEVIYEEEIDDEAYKNCQLRYFGLPDRTTAAEMVTESEGGMTEKTNEEHELEYINVEPIIGGAIESEVIVESILTEANGGNEDRDTDAEERYDGHIIIITG